MLKIIFKPYYAPASELFVKNGELLGLQKVSMSHTPPAISEGSYLYQIESQFIGGVNQDTFILVNGEMTFVDEILPNDLLTTAGVMKALFLHWAGFVCFIDKNDTFFFKDKQFTKPGGEIMPDGRDAAEMLFQSLRIVALEIWEREGYMVTEQSVVSDKPIQPAQGIIRAISNELTIHVSLKYLEVFLVNPDLLSNDLMTLHMWFALIDKEAIYLGEAGEEGELKIFVKAKDIFKINPIMNGNAVIPGQLVPLYQADTA